MRQCQQARFIFCQILTACVTNRNCTYSPCGHIPIHAHLLIKMELRTDYVHHLPRSPLLGDVTNMPLVAVTVPYNHSPQDVMCSLEASLVRRELLKSWDQHFPPPFYHSQNLTTVKLLFLCVQFPRLNIK